MCADGRDCGYGGEIFADVYFVLERDEEIIWRSAEICGKYLERLGRGGRVSRRCAQIFADGERVAYK